MQEETTYGEFKSHTKDYLKKLITKPSTAKLDDFLASRLKEKGISQGQFLKKLIDSGIVEKRSKVDDGLGEKGTGKPSYSVQYKVPNDRFEHKLKKLHITLFEENVPAGTVMEATACAGDGAGQFVQPMGGVIKRKTIYMTEEQFSNLMNTITCSLSSFELISSRNIHQYDVPFPVDDTDPTMSHNKGKKRGTAANAIGMDRMK